MARMNYHDDLPHLRRGEAIGPGLRRVVAESCEQAAQRSVRAPTDDAVHEARRALKRARAALRLGEELGATGAKAARRRLSGLARALSARRDATIAAKVAHRLAARLEATLPGEKAVAPPGGMTREAEWWAAWQRKLEAETRRDRRVARGRPTEEEVRRALRAAAKRVGKGAKRAREKGDIASVHEWRKAVITLREQMHVVRPLLSGREAEVSGKLHKLALQLGKATDYNVLARAVQPAGPRARVPAERKRLGEAARAGRAQAVRKARRKWPKVRRALRECFAER